MTELTLITATRGTLTCSEKTNPDIFKAALCHLGALGIIIRITLKCEPAFRLEALQAPAKLDEILNNLDHVVHSAEHVRFWWFPHTDDCVLWKANRTIKVFISFYSLIYSLLRYSCYAWWVFHAVVCVVIHAIMSINPGT